MFQNFEIKNFRGFQKLEINDLAQINLITGKNNVGKTALLEALFLYCGSHNPQLSFLINALRGFENIGVEFSDSAELPWNSLFYDFDNTREIQFIGQGTDITRLLKISVKIPKDSWTDTQQTKKKIKGGSPSVIKTEEPEIYPELDFEEIIKGQSIHNLLKITPSGIKVKFNSKSHFPAYFLSSRKNIPSSDDAELFGKLDILGNTEGITNILKMIEPRLKRLSVISVNKEPMLHADIGTGHLIPLPLLGEGINRLANLMLRISLAKDGVVIIDEIENGFHYGFLEDLWSVIYETAKRYNVQIFATTHSFECIKNAHNTIVKKPEYNFKLFRLDRYQNGEISIRSYSQNILDTAIATNFEVR